MRAFVLILFLTLSLFANSQSGDYYNLNISYNTYGLGSNLGDSAHVFSVEGNRMYHRLRYRILTKDVMIKDTMGASYVHRDSAFYILHKSQGTVLRKSSVDSIYHIISNAIGKLGGSNLCVKSGSVHIMTISADSIGSREIFMANSFDSTAYAITNVLLSNLHPNTVDFRPLKMWESAKRCEESWDKLMKKLDEMTPEERERYWEQRRNPKKEKPIDRREEIQKSVREELNND